MKINFNNLSSWQKAVALSWAKVEHPDLIRERELEEQAEEFLSFPDFQEGFFYTKNPDAGSFEEFKAESDSDYYIYKNFSEYFRYVFGLGSGDIYIISFDWANIGDHLERYKHLDSRTFEASTPEEAYNIISNLQEECEAGVPDDEIWDSDTSLYNCCYQIYCHQLDDLDDNDEMIPLRDLI